MEDIYPLRVPSRRGAGAFRVFLGLLPVAAVVFVLAATIDFVRKPWVAETQTRMAVTHLAGADFEVKATRLDAVSGRQYFSVYARPSGAAGKAAGGTSGETLLFRYDPSAGEPALPLLSSPAPGTLVIALPRARAILYQRPEWNHLSLRYQIGAVERP